MSVPNTLLPVQEISELAINQAKEMGAHRKRTFLVLNLVRY